ncbi:MAG: hypothetical protein KZQ98_19795 [Candidatus Thiodiazotropha sp. (ex Lucinoma borealis)]|nr:hypothetical protein [Candidatus Thiodiazotropha sp. (ex Lucinoma borealis)]
MATGEMSLFIWLVLATIPLLAGLLILRLTSRIKKMEPNGTYSNDLEHIANSGIFEEHGMVRAGDNKTVRPQSKKSSTFISCVS